MILHHHHLVNSWGRLVESVQSGQPVRTSSNRSDDTREAFCMGMHNLAMTIAPGLAPRLPLQGRRRLLDMGGGPGTYAIHCCKANPGLSATVFDLPTSEPFARRNISAFDMADRVDFATGDFHTDPIPGEYDAAWLSHILHGEDEAACQAMICKAVDALAPGGVVCVHEFILDDTMDRPLFPTLFALNMLLGTRGGRSYSQGEMSAWLKDAGVRDVARLDFRGPNDSGVLLGFKP